MLLANIAVRRLRIGVATRAVAVPAGTLTIRQHQSRRFCVGGDRGGTAVSVIIIITTTTTIKIRRRVLLYIGDLYHQTVQGRDRAVFTTR